MGNDSIKKTLGVALGLCIVCSVIVSSAAVLLKSKQEENKSLDVKKNMLLAAGLIQEDKTDKKTILDAYEQVKPVLVDLATGETSQSDDIEEYDQKKAAKDPSLSIKIPSKDDLGNIKTRAKKAKIYVTKESGQVAKVILPVHGKGLWSTLYGFLVLDKDLNTVKGFAFYEHGETPGLGGEVDNPKWKAMWIGKKVFDNNLLPKIEVIKGSVDPGRPDADHQVDGLSGATITSRGVTHLLNYWLGDNGFGPFLKKLRETGDL